MIVADRMNPLFGSKSERKKVRAARRVFGTRNMFLWQLSIQIATVHAEYEEDTINENDSKLRRSGNWIWSGLGL